MYPPERGFLVEFRIHGEPQQLMVEAFNELDCQERAFKRAHEVFGEFEINEFAFDRIFDFKEDRVYVYPDGGIAEMTE